MAKTTRDDIEKVMWEIFIRYAKIRKILGNYFTPMLFYGISINRY